MATGYQTLEFPNGRGPTLCYVVYSATFAGLSQSANNIVTCWYSNYQTSGNNESSVQFNILLAAGPPSAPGAPSFGTQTQNSNGISLDATSAAPTYTDASNSVPPPGPPGIQSYRMTASSAGDSTYRYNAAVAYSSTQFTSNTSSGIVALSQLYPDSTYNVYAQAQNDSTFTGYGPTGAAGVLSATNLAMPANSGSFSYSGTTYTAKLVATNASGNSANDPVTPVLFATPAPWASTSVTNSIQAVANRGKLGTTSIFDVSGSVVRPVGVVAALSQTASLVYDGFPIATPSTAINPGYITVTPSTPVDAYAAQTSALQGYFLNASNTVTISSSVFVASNDKTTATLTTRQNITGGATNISTSAFYYDAYALTPGTPTVTLSLRGTTSYIPISGVNVVYSTVDLSCNTSVTNLNSYFYNQTQILAYTNSAPSAETGLTNTSSIASSKIISPAVFVNSSIVYTSPASFSTSAIVAVTAYGPNNTSGASGTGSFLMIYDQPSQTLVSNSTLYPTSAPLTIDLTTTNYGFRIPSGTSNPGAAPYITTPIPPSSSTATISYVNTVSITSGNYTTDLQLTNGSYQTSGGDGYKNYTTYYYAPTPGGTGLLNTANYSGITNTGYRYATFTYYVPPGNYNAIQFVISGTSTQVDVTTDQYNPTVSASRIYFYYRGEDSVDFSTGFFTSSYINSYWTDATIAISGSNPAITSGNYFSSPPNPSNKVWAGVSSTPTSTSTTCTLNCVAPFTVTVGNTTSYIMFRIAAPMDVLFKFTGVTATFTS